MRRLFAEELGFSHVEVHTDLSRKEIKKKVEEMSHINSYQEASKTLVVAAWVGHMLRTDVTGNQKILSDLRIFDGDPQSKCDNELKQF